MPVPPDPQSCPSSPPARRRQRVVIKATPKPSLQPRRAPLRTVDQNIAARSHHTPSSTPIHRHAPAPPQTTSTIRQLRVAFQDTPLKLKDLEEGWRAHRAREIDSLTHTAPESIRNAKNEQSFHHQYAPHDVLWAKRASPRQVALSVANTPTPAPRTTLTNSKLDEAVAHQAGQTSVLSLGQASQQTLLPPTPPTSPRPKSPTVPPPAVPVYAYRSTSTRPIVAHPLAPTSGRVPLSKRTRDTIQVHAPAEAVAITLSLGGDACTLRVNRAGDELTIAPNSGSSGRQRCTIRVRDRTKWTATDHKQWMHVAGLVEEFKRHATRVKMYTPLGQVGLTCSEIPDVVLSFKLQARCTRFEGVEGSQSQGALTQVRLRYSFTTAMVELDTRTTRPRGTRMEKSKTRRSVPIEPLDQRVASAGDRPTTTDSAATALGVVVGGDWTPPEREAVKRLFTLRNEWLKFVPPYVQ